MPDGPKKDKNKIVVERYYEPSVGTGRYSDRVAINPFTSRYLDKRMGLRRVSRRA